MSMNRAMPRFASPAISPADPLKRRDRALDVEGLLHAAGLVEHQEGRAVAVALGEADGDPVGRLDARDQDAAGAEVADPGPPLRPIVVGDLGDAVLAGHPDVGAATD